MFLDIFVTVSIELQLIPQNPINTQELMYMYTVQCDILYLHERANSNMSWFEWILSDADILPVNISKRVVHSYIHSEKHMYTVQWVYTRLNYILIVKSLNL